MENIVARFLPVFLVVILGIFAGLMVGIGKPTYVVPVATLMTIPLLSYLGKDLRNLMFMMIPFLALIPMPGFHLPLSIPLLVWILILLSGVEGLIILQKKGGPGVPQSLLEFFPIIIFAAGGLVTARITGEMNRWYSSGLVLFLLLFLFPRFLHNLADAGRLIKVTFLAILAFSAFIWLGDTLGLFSPINTAPWAPLWRLLGRGAEIKIGPVLFHLWSITLGGLAGLGVVLSIFIILQNHLSAIWRWACIGALFLFIIILGITASRGATVAAVTCSAGLIVLIRWNSLRAFAVLIALAVVVLVFQDSLLGIIPFEAVQRFAEMQKGIAGIETLDYRMNVILITLERIWLYPLGSGYAYLYNTYQIDETILYSALINGTGIIGVVGYFLLMVQFLAGFLRSIISGHQRQLGALGLSLWLYNLLVGVSTESFLSNSIHTFLLGFVMIGVFWAVRLPLESKEAKPA